MIKKLTVQINDYKDTSVFQDFCRSLERNGFNLNKRAGLFERDVSNLDSSIVDIIMSMGKFLKKVDARVEVIK